MRVFVAGATGAIGKQLVPQLVAAGRGVGATSGCIGLLRGRARGPPQTLSLSCTSSLRRLPILSTPHPLALLV